MGKEFKTNIISELFNIDDEIEITEEEADYLFDMEIEILKSLENYGENGIENIYEEVTDDLLRRSYDDLLKYLGLGIDEKIKENVKKRIEDNSSLQIEKFDKSKDFFGNYLIDEIIDEIIYNLLGYEKSSDGVKEVYKKVRASLIPPQRVAPVKQILVSMFNKINFLSDKDDEEQARLILLAYDSVFEQLLEIPNHLCDTTKTMQICNMVAIKLSNIIGLSEGFRKDYLTTVQKSFNSERKLREMENQPNDD